MTTASEPLIDDDTDDEDEDEKEEKATARLDPELRVLGKILRELRALDGEAQQRAIRYLASRFDETKSVG